MVMSQGNWHSKIMWSIPIVKGQLKNLAQSAPNSLECESNIQWMRIEYAAN
jgi:hypothetical protein